MRKYFSLIIVLALLLTGCAGLPNDPANVTANVTVNNSPLPVSVNNTVTVNQTGQPLPVLASDAAEIINTTGFYEGHIAHAWHIMGKRAGFTSTTALNDVKEFDNGVANIPVLTGNETLEVVSDSANDTALGTGAQTVAIVYIDTTGNLVMSGNISLNGTSAVPTGFKAKFIEWMEVMSVGSNGVSVGNVLLRITGVGTGLEQVSAGGNRSLSARFTVPIGYTGYLTDWEVNAIFTGGGGNTNQQDARIRATEDCFDYDLIVPYHFKDIQYVSSGMSSPVVPLPFIPIPALGTVKVSTISSGTANTNRIDASFNIIIIKN